MIYWLRTIWWLGAASVPLLVGRFYGAYRVAIQCPSTGDCYTDGAEHLLTLEFLIGFSAVTVWPLFLWYGVLQPWYARRAVNRDTVDRS